MENRLAAGRSIHVESEYLPLYTNYGLTTWSPLVSGVLTGKYKKGNIPADSRFALDNYKNLACKSLVDEVLKKVDGLTPIAQELGVPLSQFAIAWCAANPMSHLLLLVLQRSLSYPYPFQSN
ncbi:NADP-dependent oxidoreductase domain [Dillenia turbinata]|uniref:NADP-dependent oxidoreductase domain n=1 Tax=Dillenia turbinata TaxID=194707 RepID=A0AAN8UCA8_9MAGN